MYEQVSDAVFRVAYQVAQRSLPATAIRVVRRSSPSMSCSLVWC